MESTRVWVRVLLGKGGGVPYKHSLKVISSISTHPLRTHHHLAPPRPQSTVVASEHSLHHHLASSRIATLPCPYSRPSHSSCASVIPLPFLCWEGSSKPHELATELTPSDTPGLHITPQSKFVFVRTRTNVVATPLTHNCHFIAHTPHSCNRCMISSPSTVGQPRKLPSLSVMRISRELSIPSRSSALPRHT